MNRMHIAIVMTAWLVASAGAGAQSPLVRCVDAAGKTTYTDQACPDGKSQRPVKLTDNTLDGTELRRQADADRAEREAQADAAPVPSQATDMGSVQACETARRNLEIARRNSRPSRDAIADAQAVVERRCPPQPALARADAACRETSIQSPTSFVGQPDERLTLADGSMWKLVAGRLLASAETQPTVTLCPARGLMYLKGRRYTLVPW